MNDKKIEYRIVLLLKIDAQRLYERIKFRMVDCLSDFSLKRTREHLGDVFKNRYDQVKIEDLCSCSEEMLVALDNFYHQADELKWYLYHTVEMPSKVETIVKRELSKLESSYYSLDLYLKAELDHQAESHS